MLHCQQLRCFSLCCLGRCYNCEWQEIIILWNKNIWINSKTHLIQAKNIRAKMTSYSKGALEEDLTSYILLGPFTASQVLTGYGMLEKERERAWKKRWLWDHFWGYFFKKWFTHCKKKFKYKIVIIIYSSMACFKYTKYFLYYSSFKTSLFLLRYFVNSLDFFLPNMHFCFPPSFYV